MTQPSGEAVHAAWRDAMLAQGRSVSPDRMSWSSLSEEDKQLDDLIALRLSMEATADRDAAIRDAAMWQRRVAKLEERMRVRAVYTFTRRVDQEWLDPSKGIHYSARANGTPYAYDVPDGVHPVTKDESPPGLYPVIVVPKELVGQIVAVRRVSFGEGERL